MPSLKSLVRGSPFFPLARNLYGTLWAGGQRLGVRRIPPPHAYKQHLVKHYGRHFHLATLVETGTYRGHMVDAVRKRFARVISIELDDALWAAATERFSEWPTVSILNGDSGVLLPEILAELTTPALFWLDAHYSGSGTAGEDANPIERELLAVLNDRIRDHIILVDDAREFTGEGGYPSIERLRSIVEGARPDVRLWIDADVIRIEPKRPKR